MLVENFSQQPMLQVVLPAEYEERIIARFEELSVIGMDKAVEKASLPKRYLQQKELMKYLGIGYETLEELYANGLKYISLGKRKLIDIEDVAEILNSMKK
ncbi:hypothetical protein HMPREF2811_02545 [Globicatella sp. HMSC072A10]|uniref:hypothetical protein n=1 Tax=Globicatella sp. HMSC072A10 TaxID=1739315 RepID=UPI0008AE7F1F|nr:hypothetical protein [Globicatella sp. HMSC072A10]OFK63713.1 hypothetical protein HMPREF2811_02545 [Globicatella sp. HMSC072A10]